MLITNVLTNICGHLSSILFGVITQWISIFRKSICILFDFLTFTFEDWADKINQDLVEWRERGLAIESKTINKLF